MPRLRRWVGAPDLVLHPALLSVSGGGTSCLRTAGPARSSFTPGHAGQPQGKHNSGKDQCQGSAVTASRISRYRVADQPFLRVFPSDCPLGKGRTVSGRPGRSTWSVSPTAWRSDSGHGANSDVDGGLSTDHWMPLAKVLSKYRASSLPFPF